MRDFSTIIGIGSVKVATAVMSLLTTLAAARIFEPSEFGQIALVWSLAAVLTVFIDFGATIQLRKRSTHLEQAPETWHAYVGHVLSGFAIRSLIALALLAAAVLLIDGERAPLFVLFAAPIAAGFILELLLSEVFRTRRRYFLAEVFTGGFRQVVYAASLAAGAAIAATEFELLSVFAAAMLSAGGLACFLIARPTWKKSTSSRGAERSALPLPTGEKGRFFAISALIMTTQQLPVLATSFMAGDETAAYVRVSLLFGVLMQFAVAANAMYFAPKIAATNKEDRAAMAALMRRSSHVGLAFVPTGLLGACAMPYVLGPVFGEAYTQSVTGAQLLILAHTLTSVIGAYPQMLLLTGFDRTNLTAAALGLIVQVCLIATLEMAFPTDVYALALGISFIMSAAYLALSGWRKSGIPPGPFAPLQSAPR